MVRWCEAAPAGEGVAAADRDDRERLRAEQPRQHLVRFRVRVRVRVMVVGWLGLGLEHLGLEVAVVDGEHVGPQAPPRADDVDDTEPVVRRRPHAGEAVRCEL